MNTKKIILSIALISNGLMGVFAQQDALFTQYTDVQLYSNAAYAGANDMMNFTAIHRQQWAGFQGAPITTGFALHSPLKKESIGLGFEIWNDKVGANNRTSIAGNFAYKLPVGKKGKLSMGLKAMADINNANYSNVQNSDNDVTKAVNSITPNVGVGVLYYSPKWFLGAGVPRLLANSDAVYSNDLHTYVLAGIILKVNETWKVRPTTQIRAAKGAPLSVDLSAAGIYNDKLWLGLNYRINESAGLFVQYQATQQFKLGYAFDFGLNELRSSNFGSHELMLSFDMNFKKSGVMSPRYF